ncbi:hypothetical protein KUTeg_013699 [Tegillarca granosa]|uniref:Tectonin beta-propeller repeat-containing protein 2 n=1 Tax=Tegillarca granosa TaxID=220873 RepID=A0ABQ9EUH5_TEGGR|nr:hypothetical protein KUTeg_013699 [Tegillarca granosa]
MDVLGRICFTSNVSMETPTGEGRWWQVPMSEILVQDVTAVDALRSLAKKFDPQKLAYIMSTTIGGLISAGSGGVWVCPEYKNVLQICRGSIEGHFWDEVVMSGISPSVVWKSICATSSDQQYGLIWTQQPNGDLFTFSPDSDKCNMVSQPLNHAFTCLAACEEAVWGLSNEGQVYIRAGIRSSCPQGTDWTKLDTSQLGDVQFISLSCGSQCVWSVDCDGIVFQRLGVKAPSTHSLPSVWLQVDHMQTGTVFTQVVSGPNDWMVWALDNRRQVYARIGITDTMPIGTEWIHVPGTPATQLTVSSSYVWALNPNGEILCRYGVTKENPGGDYWRQIPGIFVQISTSQNDKLWAISREGKIFKRHTKYLLRRQQSHDPLLSGNKRLRSATSTSSDDGWELYSSQFMELKYIFCCDFTQTYFDLQCKKSI